MSYRVIPAARVARAYRMRPKVAERFIRLNPNGCTEGATLRGYLRSRWRQPWSVYRMTRGQIIRRHGRAFFEEVKRRLHNHGNGKRGAYSAHEVFTLANRLGYPDFNVFAF